MIQINLLEARPGGRRLARTWVTPEHRPASAGVVLLLVTALGIGGWWWHLRRAEEAVDATMASAQVDLQRLHAAAQLVGRAAARKADLAERLSLIDRLHRVKHDPVELLMAISRAVPDGLWLIEMKQTGADTIQIEGRALSLTAVTDFVEALQTSGRFERPVDILTTSMETVGESTVVRFAVRGRAPGAAVIAAAPTSSGPSGPEMRP